MLGGASGYSAGKERRKVKGWEGGLRWRIVLEEFFGISEIVSVSNIALMASISSARAEFSVQVEDM